MAGTGRDNPVLCLHALARVQRRRILGERAKRSRQDGTQWTENRKEVRPLPKKWPVAGKEKEKKNAAICATQRAQERFVETIGQIPMKLEQRTDGGGETLLFNGEPSTRK